MTCDLFRQLTKKPFCDVSTAEVAAMFFHKEECIACSEIEYDGPPVTDEEFQAKWAEVLRDPECAFIREKFRA